MQMITADKKPYSPDIKDFPEKIYNPLAASLRKPGSADKLRKKLWSLRHMRNGTVSRRGIALFDAELAMHRGQFDEAAEQALLLFEDFGKQEAEGNYQKLGAAYLVLQMARYGMRDAEVSRAYSFVAESAAREEGELHYRQLAQILKAMHDLSVGFVAEIPAWIRGGAFGVSRIGDKLCFSEGGVHPANLCEALFCAIQYAGYSGDHERSLSLLETAERVYEAGGVLVVDAYFHLYRASDYHALGFPDDAKKSLEKAFSLLSADSLYQIAAEFAPRFTDLFFEVAASCGSGAEATFHRIADGLLARINDIHRKERERRGILRLTEKEREIMELISEGKTQAEITAQLHISGGTFNTHKLNAYRKLGVRDRMQIREALRENDASAEWIKKT